MAEKEEEEEEMEKRIMKNVIKVKREVLSRWRLESGEGG